MQIQFLGGATTVTGSQFLLDTERARVLIDCGMFQGSPNESIRNRIPFAFDPAELDAVLLTHAHLDHCGLLPLLVKAGLPRPDPRDRRHGRAGDPRPARLGQAPRGVRQARGALGEAPPRRGRGRRPQARPTQYRGGGRPGSRRADGAGRRRQPSRRAAADVAARPATWRARRRRRSKPARAGDPPTRGRATPRPTCAPSRRTSRSTSTRRCTRPRTPSARSPTSGRSATARSSRSRRASTPRSSMPATSSARRSSGCASRRREGGEERSIVCSGDLGRPGTPILRDPTRHDRRRLRPRRVDLRRPRARARGRGDPRSWPRPIRMVADGERRAARPVVRDRADPGGRLGARPAHRARRDPAPAALPRLADGVEGVRHLPPPPRLLRRGDGRRCCARARRRSTTRTRS